VCEWGRRRGVALRRACSALWFTLGGSCALDLVQARRGVGAKKPAAAGKFELTEEQKQEIREAFDLFDTDGSGESWLPDCAIHFFLVLSRPSLSAALARRCTRRSFLHFAHIIVGL
jgi:hypothetical protein